VAERRNAIFPAKTKEPSYHRFRLWWTVSQRIRNLGADNL